MAKKRKVVKKRSKSKVITRSKKIFTSKQIKSAQTKVICPDGFRHIDRGRFAKMPHTRHLCVHNKKKSFFFTKKPSIGI